MVMLFRLFLIGVAIIATGSQRVKAQADDSLLIRILQGKDATLDQVLSNSAKYNFQLILSVFSDNKGKDELVHYSINRDKYFFSPASLIKFPVAVVALEKLTALQARYGITIEDSLELITCSCDLSSRSYVRNTRPATFRQLLREMLILSDNDAYNVMFDFLGKDYFNTRIRQLGYQRINLRRRFYFPCDYGAQERFGGFRFYDPLGKLQYEIPCQTSQGEWRNDSNWPHTAGQKHLENGKWVAGPKSFLDGNYVSLWEAHRLLIDVLSADTLPDSPFFAIEDSMRQELIDALGSYPRALQSGRYQGEKYPDHYYKYFLDPKTMVTADNQLKIYNKVGISGGFISDVSYFYDQQSGLRFFLSGAMLAKKDGLMDNGKYDYYDIGIPVFRKIGSLVYAYLMQNLPESY